VTDRGGSDDIRALIFDMGGVLVELGEPDIVFGLESGTERFLEHWIQSPSVRDFERGDIDIESFARRVVRDAALPYGWQEFIQRFMSWPRSAFTGAAKLLESLPGNCQRVLLSNTNREHWHDVGLAAQLTPYLDRVFLSFESGHLKPDPIAFHHVFESIDCAPEETAFFDDNSINVEAAKALGCHAFRTRGVDELQAAIEGLLSG